MYMLLGSFQVSFHNIHKTILKRYFVFNDYIVLVATGKVKELCESQKFDDVYLWESPRVGTRFYINL